MKKNMESSLAQWNFGSFNLFIYGYIILQKQTKTSFRGDKSTF